MNRRADITIIRVTCMLMIVMCHIVKYYQFIPGSQVINQFLNVGVQVFLLISGYIYGNKDIINYKGWLLKRIQRIWIPILFVVAVDIVVLKLFFFSNISIPTCIVYLLNLQGMRFVDNRHWGKLFAFIENLGPLWFTTVIMICYILLPFIAILRDKLKGKKEKQITLILALFLIGFILEIKTGINLSYFFVFFTGYFLESFDIEKQRFSNIKVIICVIIILALCIARVILRHFIDGTQVYVALISIGHACLGTTIFLLGILLNIRYSETFQYVAESHSIRFLDGGSYYIYLLHGIFCMGETNIYYRFSLLPATFLFVVSTLLTTLILWKVTDYTNSYINKLADKIHSLKK